MPSSPSTRRAWIEIGVPLNPFTAIKSPSTRRAWIEITLFSWVILPFDVALHPEGVDRNKICSVHRGTNITVALHPEGVDRNINSSIRAVYSGVALHPEGVDRNRKKSLWINAGYESPSTRRAWIEIQTFTTFRLTPSVALHPEGVDRNIFFSSTGQPRRTVALHPGGRG